MGATVGSIVGTLVGALVGGAYFVTETVPLQEGLLVHPCLNSKLVQAEPEGTVYVILAHG